MKRSRLLLVSAIACALGQTAFADDPPAANKSVQERIDALQKEIDELKEEQQKSKLTAQEQARVAMNSNRATITSADGRSSIAFRAIVQADAALYDQDPAGPLSTDYRRGSVGAVPNRENNGARDLSSGIYFRRARFGFEGTIARDFGYRFVAELGGSGTETAGRINDAWISYTGFAPLTIQVGAYSPPANLEDGTPVEDTLFIERSTPSELSRSLGGADGRIGLGVRGSGSRWMGALTLTNRTVADPEVFDAQTAIVGRVGFLALIGTDYNLHLGASGTYVIHPPDQGVDAAGARYFIRFRDRPELRVDSTRLIDTGNIDANHAYVYGAELGANWRNFYFQGEHFWYGVDRLTATDPTFTGYYLQGSWVITGETHRYNMASASFSGPRASRPFSATGGFGAWELALRFSHMDLNQSAGAVGTAPTTDSIRGGVQDIWTFGVNWYVVTNIRFTLDYYHVDVDRLNPAGPGNTQPFGPAPATPPVGVQIGQQYNALGLRSQFSF